MKDIDKIIDKYFEGETSLDEEKLLREYFQKDNIDEKYKAYAPMFRFFSEERKEIVPVISKKRTLIYIIAGIAASLVLFITGTQLIHYLPLKNDNSKSMVYINGKKKTDIKTINYEALNSIESISDINEDVISSQIDILESFTE